MSTCNLCGANGRCKGINVEKCDGLNLSCKFRKTPEQIKEEENRKEERYTMLGIRPVEDYSKERGTTIVTMRNVFTYKKVG